MDRLEHALKYVAKRKPAKAGFIYFIQCHEFIKVGFTDKVAIRLSSLQTGCPYELKLIHSIASKDMEVEESLIHKRWQCYEIRGEWFRLPESMLTVIVASETVDELLED